MAGRNRKAPLTRSEIMSRVRGKDTAPEMRVRRALWAAGLRYRLHDKTLPGCPDIVFRSRRIVVLVHGCFWHGHQDCPRHRIPKTRVEWWTEKMRRNQERDAQVRAALGADGWTVLVLWECETESPPKLDALVRAIKAARRR
ncbi:MAG: DNA mismatch endonuclease Vsr [Alphaproteobacteria bacterium]|nr:DNA mismatch endonuclease Vsr [Alphaproteobacteria bacterium]